MKKFIYKTSLLTSLLLVVLVVINYMGDAANIFNSEYEKQMAKILINGDYVTNISNFDDRIFQKELIHDMESAPEILVLGSSRTMMINSDHFQNTKLFNSSVTGASMEDIIALFQMYKERNLLPKKVIIGIDPWLLNENNGQSRWKSIKNFYNRYDKNANSNSIKFKNFIYKYDQLISLSYFQASLKSLIKETEGNSKPLATINKYNSTNTKLLDGSLVFNSAYRDASQIEINFKIKRYIQGRIYSIENFEDISDDIWYKFKSFVLDLKNKNIAVNFFICPYAPLVFDKVSKEYPNVIRTENLINDFAQDNEIKVYGSFNPYKLGFDETYFYDGMHCKEKGNEKILNDE